MLVREAAIEDAGEIRAVVSAAFGQSDEADLVEALRADGDIVVELVAVEQDFIVGHLLFSPLITDTDQKFAALAPLSVMPNRQREGIGTLLMQVGHELCRKAGTEAIVVLGHPAYYPRVGYSADAARTVHAPFSGEHFMALPIVDGALSAPVRVTYAKAFGL
jgi:putative acetyltransferase